MNGFKVARAHAVVALSVVVVALFALLGVTGEDHHPERIDQLRYDITAADDQGLRITETIDQDFGSASRHGPEIVIPNDLGVVSDVVASSPDAPDDVSTAPVYEDGRSATRIRVGDPDVTVSGQHRYVVSYTLPDARFSGPDLYLDVLAPGDLEIGKLTIAFSGVSLVDPRCTFGAVGSDDECQPADESPLRYELTDLPAQAGVTVSGEVAAWEQGDGAPDVPIPERRTSNRGLVAAVTAAVAAVTGGAVFLWARKRGSNEVVGSSPAEAAHGVAAGAASLSHSVTDAELEAMTTIEFAPPRGLEPWQGAVVLTEKLDDSSVTAWFSGAIASDVLGIEVQRGKPRLSQGPAAARADAKTANVLRLMFGNREVVDLDGYDAQFAVAWAKVASLQDEWIAQSGWWRGRPPSRNRLRGGGCLSLVVLTALIPAGFLLLAVVAGLLGGFGGIATGVLAAIGIPALVARVAYAPLLASRTANGSAYALQVGSFRRFLVESEGQYVEWAWKNGLLRQYSAWAVALDAADAWRQAMERAGVPQPEIDAGSPLLVHSMNRAFLTSHVEPPSTSSDGGSSSFSSGGFSGSVGGGGGGSSHGSW
ncbi:MAG: DUF2207 domain-containing protein [Acidimicrobiales bacterium]|nr:DUF2207 domain-containing protein [Acidimicrobiales bacterium]